MQSYHAQVNPEAIGLMVKTFVLVSPSTGARTRPAKISWSRYRTSITSPSATSLPGRRIFLIKIVCKDIPTYERLLFKTLQQIDEIERLKTLMTLSTVKDVKRLPYDYEGEE